MLPPMIPAEGSPTVGARFGFVLVLDAQTGEVQWVNDSTASDYVRLPHSDARGYGGLAPQGYLAVSADQVVVAGGRTPPVYLDRQTGELQAAAFRTKQDGDYAVHAGGMGMQRNSMLVQRVADVQDQLDGEVFYKLAAQDRLIVTTDEGTLYCFGPERNDPVRHAYQPEPLAPRTGDWSETAAELLAELGESEGYALLLGAGSGDLLRELLVRSDLHLVVVEADRERVAALRDELMRGGQYGTRAAVIRAEPAAFAVQPYLFSLIVSEDAGAVGLAAEPDTVACLLDRLRPYGGTAWLGYFQPQDTLLMGGRWGGLRWFDDEPRERLAVFRGTSGQPLWERNLGAYYGPLALGNDQIYVAPAARSGSGKALWLSSGETVMRTQPSRDQQTPWGYHRRYGCNTHNVSTHLLTFRSGYAGYFDLKHDSGTGNFAGFRSGCTNNLVVADGVVSAPDYTRTCTCSYAHQTSLALIPMPEDVNLEFWTRYEGAYPDPRQHGLNFGAPGRRVDSRTGRIWHDRPGDHRRHASAIRDAGDSQPWVLASAHEAEADEQLVIEDVIPGTYRLQLHFAELDPSVAAGMRVFDVLADDRVLLEDFDMVAAAGGVLRGVVREFRIRTEGPLQIHLRPAAGTPRGPAINGIELVAETE